MIKVFTGILYDFVMNNLKNDKKNDKSPSYFHKTWSQHL